MTRYAFIATYIMASGRNGTLYTGVTSDLFQRVWQHKNGTFPGFSRKHGCKGLVWFEQHAGMTAAIRRERAIKGWNRAWKLRLLLTENPVWRDLSEDWFEETTWDFAGTESLASPRGFCALTERGQA